MLPAREFPLSEQAIARFRSAYRNSFEGDPQRSLIYREVSNGNTPGGIEYYLPLFFDETASLVDYLSPRWVVAAPAGLEDLFDQFEAEARERFEMCSLDRERPILTLEETFLAGAEVPDRLEQLPQIRYSANAVADGPAATNFETRMPPAMKIETRYEDAAAALVRFLDAFDGRVLFSTDSPGRREQLYDMLNGRGLDLARTEDWRGFLADAHRIGIAVAPVENGVLLPEARIAVISEQQLFGERTRTRKRRCLDTARWPPQGLRVC